MSRLLSLPLALPRGLKAPLGRRTKVLAATLVVAAGLAVGSVMFHAEESASVPARAHSKAASSPAVARIATKAPHKERLPVRAADSSHAAALFAVHSWYVPPPPPPTPSVPPASAASLAPPIPTAPPLPFQYMGSYTPHGETPVFFLTRGDRVYDVRVGDTLDGTYSIDSFNGTQLLLTYKPLNIQQQLTAGGAQ